MENHRKKGQAERPLPRPLAQPVSITIGEGRLKVELNLSARGSDLLLLVSGGEVHVGAVAACDGRPGSAPVDESRSAVQLPGHREGPLAVEAAVAVATAAQCRCAAVVGIHQDAATADEIDMIVDNVRSGLSRLAAQLRENALSEGRP